MSKNICYEVCQTRQSNHQSFHIPQSIRHLGRLPLYQAVIWWGFYLGKEFSREELSCAFKIDLRRASAILNYICHRIDNHEIIIEFHNKSVDGGRSRLYVSIAAVSFKKAASCKAMNNTRADDNQATIKQERQLAQWLLTRPSGGDTENLEKWKAACPVSQKD